MYYSIVGDIVSSKSLEDRLSIQSKFRDYLEKLNNQYKQYFHKKMFITLGDEFQGLFTSFAYVMEVIHKIEVHMWPVKLRFGIGVGNLEFDFGSEESPYQSDGEVWWNARKSIDLIKDNHKKNKQAYYSNIAVHTNNDSLNRICNDALNLCYAIRSNWTDKQREIIHYIIQHYGLSDNYLMVDIADVFNQTNSTIYDKLKAAKYVNYSAVMRSLQTLKSWEGSVL